MLDDKIFTFNSYMKQKFGARVARIALHTGFNYDKCDWPIFKIGVSYAF